MSPHDEVGRELKVSELKPDTVVVLVKEGHRAMTTAWVVKVGPGFVHFRMGSTYFLAQRIGADREEITDDAQNRLKIHEYLGKV